jgi:putative GTP pyrophosphokinase
MLGRQDDLKVITIKDYIKSPKENGYRSCHMIVEVPVYFSRTKRLMRVEIQIRTIAMNFWASLEHQIRYKKTMPGDVDMDLITEELREAAETIAETDKKMLEIKNRLAQYEDLSETIY